MAEETRVVMVDGKPISITRVLGHEGDGLPLSVIQKYIPREELAALGVFLRSRRIDIAFTTGAFDMIHAGHKRYLELGASLGNVLVVGLNSDLSVKALKGDGRPILNQEQRLEMLCALACVTYATIFPEITGAETIRILKPSAYLCVEGSWEGDLEAKAEVVAMAEHGGEIYYAPRQSPTLSTTAILQKIENQLRVGILEELTQEMKEK